MPAPPPRWPRRSTRSAASSSTAAPPVSTSCPPHRASPRRVWSSQTTSRAWSRLRRSGPVGRRGRRRGRAGRGRGMSWWSTTTISCRWRLGARCCRCWTCSAWGVSWGSICCWHGGSPGRLGRRLSRSSSAFASSGVGAGDERRPRGRGRWLADSGRPRCLRGGGSSSALPGRPPSSRSRTARRRRRAAQLGEGKCAGQGREMGCWLAWRVLSCSLLTYGRPACSQVRHR
jgi:hypothetical protein